MDIAMIVSLICGLLVCLFGYKLNKILITIICAIFGYYLVTTFGSQIFNDETFKIIVSLIVALVFGYFGFKLYLVGVFLTCFFLVNAICYNFITDEMLEVVVGLLAGLVIGIIAVKFTRPIMIISTSFSGSFMAADNLFNLLNFTMPAILLITSIILAIIGIAFQFKNTQIES